jgi:MIP family channel proteins
MAVGTREYIAEFIGTFGFVFYGTVSVTVFAGAGLLGIGFAHGLILMAIVYALGPVSGAHVNPAVSVAMVVQRKLTASDGAAYVIFQCLGAAFAGLFHSIIIPQGANVAYGLTFPTRAIGNNPFTAVVIETLLTFFFVLVIFSVTLNEKATPGVSGAAIGMTLAASIMVGGAFTGAALNPARALGPAIASGIFNTLWVYWVGPIIGALIAGYVYAFLQRT